MGSAFNRGTRDRPNWYVKFKDRGGKWKMVPSHQPTKALASRYVGQIEGRIAAGKVGIEQPEKLSCCGDLMDLWSKGLVNRNAADDRTRLKRHVRPVFEALTLPEVTQARIMEWIDQQRVAAKICDASIRHNLNLLSRFFSWTVERGHASVNPVRHIPIGRRPRQTPKLDVPWLNDENLVRILVRELPAPFDLMFYLGNRSGLRTGEIAGLRISDLAYLADGTMRVRYSYEGPLKEDKNGGGKVKWVPACDDAEAVLGPLLKRREADGAQPEDLVFPCPTRKNRCYRKELIESRWDVVREKRKLELTWYQATRHSFVTRSLVAGASLDEVSAAVGHSSPVVTRRFYDHFVRRAFSSTLRTGLGLGGEANGVVVPFPKATSASKARGAKKSTRGAPTRADAPASADGPVDVPSASSAD